MTVEDRSELVLQSIRSSGGIVNTSIAIGVITGVIHDLDNNLLLENGFHINVNKKVARRLLTRMNFVKRRGTTKNKITVENFKVLEAQFLEDIHTLYSLKACHKI